LPAVQMVLTSALLWWTRQSFDSAAKVHLMAGTPAAFKLCMALNAPLALARVLWSGYRSRLPDDLIFIAAVGVLWYWVALNIEYWRQHRAVLMFSCVPLRLAGDVLLVGTGLFLGFWAVKSLLLMNWSQSAWFIPSQALVLTWSFLLVGLFGRDWISCILLK
jgi:hypothetical protein